MFPTFRRMKPMLQFVVVLKLRPNFHTHCHPPPPPPRNFRFRFRFRHSLSHVADTCKSTSSLKQVHAQMIVTGRMTDNYAASRILSSAAASDLPYTLTLLHHTASPNSFMWNTAIRALADSPFPSDAVLLYVDMLRVHNPQPPGKHTFPFLLKACAALKDEIISTQVHGHVCKQGFEKDVYVANGLIRCYAVGGRIDDARKVFDGMADRNSVVWTTMVGGYVRNSRTDEGLLLFDRMVREGVEPNDATFAVVLSACARSGRLELGEKIHSFLEEKGVEIGVILGTALVDMYAKSGVISKAQKLFDQMGVKNTATWNAFICGLAHHGHADAALRLFGEMEKENREEIRSNDVTFVGVLSACCHAGYLDLGRGIFGSIIAPKIEHYGCMVDLLGRSGRLQEAYQLVRSMRWKADVAVLGALLTACEKHKNVGIAESVARRILELEPFNHSVYVALSNIYAESGEWDHVVGLRKMMESGGLKKIPGWSCVGGDGS